MKKISMFMVASLMFILASTLNFQLDQNGKWSFISSAFANSPHGDWGGEGGGSEGSGDDGGSEGSGDDGGSEGSGDDGGSEGSGGGSSGGGDNPNCGNLCVIKWGTHILYACKKEKAANALLHLFKASLSLVMVPKSVMNYAKAEDIKGISKNSINRILIFSILLTSKVCKKGFLEMPLCIYCRQIMRTSAYF